MNYSSDLHARQRAALFAHGKNDFSDASPCCHFERSGNGEDRKVGQELLRQGKIGCLVLAGGQGTRLGVDGPKGAVAVTPFSQKSLFQLFCERAAAASAWAEKSLPLCIMTSPLNDEETRAFFKQHNNFGLGASQVSFFSQEMLPFLDDRGNWLHESPDKIAAGPDGNGHALRLFYETGIWERWHQAGIEYLNVIFVDNALADPFDAEFAGFAARRQTDAALKAIERGSPEEKMGALAERNGKLKVIEYSELPEDASAFSLSSTGMFCVAMPFIRYLCEEIKAEMPLHLARKTAKAMLSTAHGSFKETVKVWKCERFIFDILDFARKSAVLVCPKEKIYAPLKNASGDKSLETVKQALLLHDRAVYQALTGLLPPVEEFELDPFLYYSRL